MRVRKFLNLKLDLNADGHYILKVIMFKYMCVCVYVYILSLIKRKQIGVEMRMRIAAGHCLQHVFKSRNDNRMSCVPVFFWGGGGVGMSL
jgi:hypothetical protein